MDQLFVAPTFAAAAAMAAAVDAGLYADAGTKVLMTTSNSPIPELGGGLAEQPGFGELARRFDRVVSLNETIYPQHPCSWSPAEDVERWHRILTAAVGLREPFGITLQSLPAKPSTSLLRVFPEGPVDVVSDGLADYGPLPTPVPRQVAPRLRRLLHLDLAGGLVPVLPREHEVADVVLSSAGYRDVVAEHGKAAASGSPGEKRADAIVLGQDLSTSGPLSPEEEQELHEKFLRVAAGLGHRQVVLTPRPSALPAFAHRLPDLADELGLRLRVLDDPVPAEVLYDRLRPAAVIGCFSAELSTAVEVYGTAGYAVGVDEVLERLPKPQDSSRVPLAITDVRLNHVDVASDGALVERGPVEIDLQLLVDEIAHAMRRPGAASGDRKRLLAEHPWTAKFFPEAGDVAGRAAVVPVPQAGAPGDDQRHADARAVARKVRSRLRRDAGRLVRQASRRSGAVRRAKAVAQAVMFRPH
ncbi:polysialyltransferase family glycosyltransferase [Promicromonospora kroppenstedtii]|uniref:Polysialyltransferase family glycosyltransferase n=1 Tax=Promicromonospora kroppenstedtii TaxID=440482 RepID=A0ABW7XS91_9MICO